MQRRGFLASSLAASALAGTTPAADASGADPTPAETGRDYYLLRRYVLRRGPQQKMIDDFFRDAAIPAMNRLGIKPVGAFNVSIGPGSPTLYILTPHPSVDSVITTYDRVSADPEYQKAGAAFINTPPTEPAYARVESSLLLAFEGMPKLEVPAATAESKPRIFELRTYESHSRKAGRTKIRMFNTAEMAIFRRIGFKPVFFGETVIGSGMPSLAYMLAFADMEERARSWAAFGADPEWQKLSTSVGNTDGEIVSSITNVILSPTAYSQI